MSVIVNAYTGQKEGLNLESAPPSKLDELGAELQATIPAVGTSATSATSRADGVLAGSLVVHGHSRSGWWIFVGTVNARLAREHVARHMAMRAGRFSFRLAPGKYQIGALEPHGDICGTRTVHVSRGKETRVTLRCP